MTENDILTVADLQDVECKKCGALEDGIVDNKGQQWCGSCWEKLVANGQANGDE